MQDTQQTVRFTKILGSYIDEKKSWNEQISFVKNKLGKMCGILHRIRNNLTPESLTRIYYTLCYNTSFTESQIKLVLGSLSLKKK